ncbi:anamorsin homolog isoform X1 [Branchiostoma floridae]|uniref:Anamorsin homolog n=1 Tax=Branchiostoma floridae TaxID=7739 RepID=A0A9J7MVA2_BRAFL|nr:anamorsin homolog isoform X1 [Branchiostoma floridae]
MEYVNPGQSVLLLWGGAVSGDTIQMTVGNLQTKVGEKGHVRVEHVDRLLLSNHGSSTFDVVLSGTINPPITVHSGDVLAEVARLLKPSGRAVVCEPTVSTDNGGALRTAAKLSSSLKLAGMVSVSEAKEISLSQQEHDLLKQALSVDGIQVVEVSASKPSYEVGSSAQLTLSFAKKKQVEKPKLDENTAKIWSLSAVDMNDDDIDLLDPDELLDEEDLKKPDPASLKAQCGTGGDTKKRKACKNCTCGLAEELEGDQPGKTASKPATSACGNCYLGDAFRCASCPYLGMPAFKPGEKITLTDRQLKGDI